MSETPQATSASRNTGIPTNGTPGVAVPQQDVAAMLDGLERRLASQPLIEQSKGILMGHFGMDPETAFALLRRWSSYTNLKIRDISQLLVTTVTTRQRTNSGAIGQQLTDLIESLNQGRHPAAGPGTDLEPLSSQLASTTDE
jgi:ANTAR domain-containing protein